MKTFLIIVAIVGFTIRLILIGNPGFEADISFWKSWSLAAVDHGIVWTAHNTNINYPPGFIYILWIIGKIYTLFGNPHDYYTYWRQNNFAFLVSTKLIGITADAVLGLILFWFLSQKDKLTKLGAQNVKNPRLPLLIFSVFFLHPAVWLDSAIWGQVESLGVLTTVIAIILLFFRKPLLASSIFTIGFLLKLQNIIYIPLIYLFIARYFDIKTMVRSIAVALFTFILVTLPFILAKDLNQVLYLLTVNSDYFPWLSLNAHNLWWIVAGGQGMQIIDKITVLGITNAKTLGFLLFAASYLFGFILLFKKPTPGNLILVAAYSIFSFYLWPTQSHERYSYPVLVLLLLYYPLLNDKSNFRKYFWLVYVLLSFSIFYNINTGLVLNYPYNGVPFVASFTSPPFTLLNSYLSIIIFFLLVVFLVRQLHYSYFILCILLFLALVFVQNLSYLINGKVSLTHFKPISIKQDFAQLQLDKSVNSYSGWKSWSRLSNNYFFYRKGFGTHAVSNVVFDINRKFTRIVTDMGIDTEAGTQATVEFVIWGDDKQLYRSGKMGRFDFPKHADINITGVKYLKLEVTDGDDGINSDHADWLNPILYR